MAKERSFKLFSSCIPIKGSHSSLIYDLERRKLYPIDNIVYEMLLANVGRTTKELKAFYKYKQDKGIDVYMNMFVNEELGFFTTEPEQFPSLNLEWKSPYQLQNAILEITNTTNYSISKVMDQLDGLNCHDIQLRIFDDFNVEDLNLELNRLLKSRIKAIQIYISHEKCVLDLSNIFNLLQYHKRISQLVIYNVPKDFELDLHIKARKDDPSYLIEKYKQRIRVMFDNITIGQRETIHSKYMTGNTTIPIFTEAQKHNTGLNRKVSINSKGEIMNYVSHEAKFGHVDKVSIESIINTEAFKEKWFIDKSMITKCKDCPFRYACVNNTDLIKEEDFYTMADDCTFDPLSNQFL